eukprot:565802-Amphidinium_carterae.4
MELKSQHDGVKSFHAMASGKKLVDVATMQSAQLVADAGIETLCYMFVLQCLTVDFPKLQNHLEVVKAVHNLRAEVAKSGVPLTNELEEETQLCSWENGTRMKKGEKRHVDGAKKK